MSENLFLQASRQKLRFATKAGVLSVEDLWDIPLESTTKVNLDEIAIGLNNELKNSGESFVKSNKKNEVLQLKLDIVKFVISTRLAEAQAKVDVQQRNVQRQRLQELIEKKKNEDLLGKSVEELEALLKNT